MKILCLLEEEDPFLERTSWFLWREGGTFFFSSLGLLLQKTQSSCLCVSLYVSQDANAGKCFFALIPLLIPCFKSEKEKEDDTLTSYSLPRFTDYSGKYFSWTSDPESVQVLSGSSLSSPFNVRECLFQAQLKLSVSCLFDATILSKISRNSWHICCYCFTFEHCCVIT